MICFIPFEGFHKPEKVSFESSCCSSLWAMKHQTIYLALTCPGLFMFWFHIRVPWGNEVWGFSHNYLIFVQFHGDHSGFPCTVSMSSFIFYKFPEVVFITWLILRALDMCIYRIDKKCVLFCYRPWKQCNQVILLFVCGGAHVSIVTYMYWSEVNLRCPSSSGLHLVFLCLWGSLLFLHENHWLGWAAGEQFLGTYLSPISHLWYYRSMPSYHI